MTDQCTYRFEYHMEPAGTPPLSYKVEIDKDTLVSRVTVPDPLPAWVRLENGACGECSLQGSAYCPIAVRLIEPIRHKFGGLNSHVKCTTTVITPERSYVKKAPDVQRDALRSLFRAAHGHQRMPVHEAFQIYGALSPAVCFR